MADDKTRMLTAEELGRLAALAEPAEDKTRVLSADEAARLLGGPESGPPPKAAAADREPHVEGDKIVFFCANGHRLVVDRALAGKRGKCSKRGCSVPVVIPFAADPNPHREAGPAAECSGGAAPAAVAAAPPPPLEAAFDLDAPAATAGPAPAAGPPPTWDFMGGGAGVPGAPPVAPGVGPGADPGAAAVDWTFDIDAIDNPTARLVARLWVERAHGGVVEVHLSGGSVIMPEFFDPQWSCGTHALFATAAPDETVTLTAVAWDQIQKVVVRKVQGKPDGMFET